jgi:hypothetical protein
MVPKLNINLAGAVLVWSYTLPFTKPAGDGTTLTIPVDAEEATIVKSQMTALMKLLSDRVSAEKYFALQVRPAYTEEDVSITVDALAKYYEDLTARALPLPEVIR